MWSCKDCCGGPLPPERQLAADQAQALTDLERRIAIPLFVAKMHGAKEPAIDRALAEALPAAMRLWDEVADPLCLILCPGGQGGDGRGLRQFPTTFEASASRRRKEPTTRAAARKSLPRVWGGNPRRREGSLPREPRGFEKSLDFLAHRAILDPQSPRTLRRTPMAPTSQPHPQPTTAAGPESGAGGPTVPTPGQVLDRMLALKPEGDAYMVSVDIWRGQPRYRYIWTDPQAEQLRFENAWEGEVTDLRDVEVLARGIEERRPA